MQVRPSLAEIRNVQGFLHKLQDDPAGPGLGLNELCLGDSSSMCQYFSRQYEATLLPLSMK